MNFEIFDDEFELDKPKYEEEIKQLSKNLVQKEYKTKWKKFVEGNLVSTRNYYIIITALKVMKNLEEGTDYETALISALSFMPDLTFMETVIIVVGKFHKKGKEFASHHKIDMKAYEEPKPKTKSKVSDKKFEAKKNIKEKLKKEDD